VNDDLTQQEAQWAETFTERAMIDYQYTISEARRQGTRYAPKANTVDEEVDASATVELDDGLPSDDGLFA
jgi:hypothetical protein